MGSLRSGRQLTAATLPSGTGAGDGCAASGPGIARHAPRLTSTKCRRTTRRALFMRC